jgi:hypothetical protein
LTWSKQTPCFRASRLHVCACLPGILLPWNSVCEQSCTLQCPLSTTVPHAHMCLHSECSSFPKPTITFLEWHKLKLLHPGKDLFAAGYFCSCCDNSCKLHQHLRKFCAGQLSYFISNPERLKFWLISKCPRGNFQTDSRTCLRFLFNRPGGPENLCF